MNTKYYCAHAHVHISRHTHTNIVIKDFYHVKPILDMEERVLSPWSPLHTDHLIITANITPVLIGWIQHLYGDTLTVNSAKMELGKE